MSFKREIKPVNIYASEELNSALISIGIGITGNPSLNSFNIEDVLLSASIEGMVRGDYRVLGLLTDWIEMHGRLINVDRLSKIVSLQADEKVRRYWKAISQWQSKDVRFKKLSKNANVEGRSDLLGTGTDFLIQKHGEDPRFEGTVLRVPNLTLRHRLEDIQSADSLSRKNRFYRSRLMIGPSYRADVWAYLLKDRELSSSELARLTYSSFATAWGVKRDFEIYPRTQLKADKVPA